MKLLYVQGALLGIASLSLAAVPSGVQKFELRRKEASETNNTLLRPLQLNDKWITAGGYFIDIAVGTPPQQFEVSAYLRSQIRL